MSTLPFLHAVSFLPILLSTVSTQGTGNVFLYERSISECHKDVKISGVQMPYHYTGTYVTFGIYQNYFAWVFVH